VFEKFSRTSKINPPTIVALSFLIAIALGTILLSLPIATHARRFALVDALFTATSATCVTGLIVVDTGRYFTLFGQLVILFLIQIGGLGIMTFSTFFTILLGKKMSMKDKLVMQDALDYFELGSIGRLINRILLVTFSIELLGALPLFLRWRLSLGPWRAAYYALFHSVSAFCNAGFSLFSAGMMPYQSDMVINLGMISLIVLGGLGFVVLLDAARFFLLKLRKARSRLLLQTKVVLATSLSLILIGTILLWLLEQNNTLRSLSGRDKLLASLFQAVTCRTAGFNTLPIGALTTASLVILIILMFIGASPGSTGGGIKTTTFAIFMATLHSLIYGHEEVHLFRRTIPRKNIHKAAAIIGLSVLAVTVATITLIVSEKSQPFGVQPGYPVRIFFEIISAFGTVGLSTGITPQLSTTGRLLTTLIMFIGRIGPLTLALAIGRIKPPPAYKYPEGRIMVG
jgi:trk system potassium uptake protein TrkH